MEEKIVKAYFTDGMNIADFDTLVQLAAAIGLEEGAVKKSIEQQ